MPVLNSIRLVKSKKQINKINRDKNRIKTIKYSKYSFFKL